MYQTKSTVHGIFVFGSSKKIPPPQKKKKKKKKKNCFENVHPHHPQVIIHCEFIILVFLYLLSYLPSFIFIFVNHDKYLYIRYA